MVRPFPLCASVHFNHHKGLKVLTSSLVIWTLVLNMVLYILQSDPTPIHPQHSKPFPCALWNSQSIIIKCSASSSSFLCVSFTPSPEMKSASSAGRSFLRGPQKVVVFSLPCLIPLGVLLFSNSSPSRPHNYPSSSSSHSCHHLSSYH